MSDDINQLTEEERRLWLNKKKSEFTENLVQEAAKQSNVEVIHVKVDEPETQGEEVKAAKELFKDLKEKASTELTALGVDTDVEDIKSKADLDRAVATIKQLRSKNEPKTGFAQGGSAPLSGQYQQQGQSGQQFESIEDLINNLRDRSSYQNPNKEDQKLAKAQLDQLMLKAVKGQKEANKPFSYSPNPEENQGTLDMLKSQFERRKKLKQGET